MEKIKVASFDFANEDIYQVIQDAMPEEFELVSLKTGSLEEKIKIGADAEFFIAATGAIPGEVIRGGKKLRLIQQQGVGFDKTDVAQATKLGIEVCITPEGTSIGVAEHVVLLILAVYKKVALMDKKVRDGEFPMWDYRTKCHEIFGKTIGFVGFGRIAKETAKRLGGFDPKIHFFDKYVNMSLEEQKELNVKQVHNLDELLGECDIISIHVPSNEITRGMVDKNFFLKMKRNAIFINTARGDLVVEKDFVDAINQDVIAGAGIDVFPKEPLPKENPYRELKNVVLTPHVSAGTVDALRTKIKYASANIQRFIRGEETLHSLNRTEIANENRRH